MDEWINVNKQPPPNGVPVLIYTIVDYEFKILLHTFDEYKDMRCNFVTESYISNQCSHWMPLPNPPENG